MEECPDKNKMARNNGSNYIDMPIKNIYKNWISYLQPFVVDLEQRINDLQYVPLGSNISSKDKSLNGIIK